MCSLCGTNTIFKYISGWLSAFKVLNVYLQSLHSGVALKSTLGLTSEIIPKGHKCLIQIMPLLMIVHLNHTYLEHSQFYKPTNALYCQVLFNTPNTFFYISLTVYISQFTVHKTPTKCTSLYHFFISLDPYICFGLCKNHHQGVFKTTYIYIQWYFCPYCYAIS